jgi:hypothetical protein
MMRFGSAGDKDVSGSSHRRTACAGTDASAQDERYMEDLSRGIAAERVERANAASSTRHLLKIKRAIRRMTSGGVHELAVEQQSDTVFLRGHCTSFYCKQIA